MHKNFLLIFVVACLSYTSLAQNIPSKREIKKYKKLYGVALNGFFDLTATNFVLVDSTDNRRIRLYNFLPYTTDTSRNADPRINDSWKKFLAGVELRKKDLPVFRLAKPKSIHTILLVNSDTFYKALNERHLIGNSFDLDYPHIDGWMTVSSPILSDNKNMAIIEISYTISSLNAYGFILLLEKNKRGKWIIFKKINTWVA